MSNPSDFIIENGVLKSYVGPGGDVVIPEGVTSIGDSSFRDCDSLTGIVIPEGVTRIGSDAFRTCRNLKAIRLPASLNRIGNNAFRECRELTQLDICDVAAWCAVAIANDYAHPLYEAGRGNWRMNVPGKSGSLLLKGEPVCELVIPEGVCEIAQSVFTNCINITAVSIPPSLKKIAPKVFCDCTQIKTVKIRDLSAWNRVCFESLPGLDKDYTGMNANPLYHGAALVLNGDTVTQLNLSGDLEAIGDYAYCGCGSLTSVTLEEGIKTVGKDSFHNCKALHSVSFPRSLSTIGREAFVNCKKLKTVQIEDLSAWLSVKLDGIWSTNPLSNGADLLLNGEPVRKLTIPEGVTSIGSSMFAGCSSLRSVTIPESVKGIGDWAFQNCSSLTSVTIPEGLTSIGCSAFSGCGSLTSVTIPESVTSIGWGAFAGCASLRSVILCTCPSTKGWFKSGGHPFAGRRMELWVGLWTKETASLLSGAEFTAIHTESISAVPTMNRAMAAVGFAMEEKHDLSTTRAAEHMAFLKKHAAKLSKQMTEHPAAVYFLCEQKLLPAAALDEYMREATEHNNVELKARLLSYQNELGQGAVSKARTKKEKVKEEYEDALVGRVAERDPSKGIEGLTFVLSGKSETFVWESKNELEEHLALYGAKLGSSVNKATDYLVNCGANGKPEKARRAEALGVPVISETEFHEMIGKTFKDAPEITLPGWLRFIPDSAFEDFRQLKRITIPDGVTSIGDRAFHGCSGLTSLTIPDGVTSIGENAFYGCKQLEELTIPESVTSIRSGAFKDTALLRDESRWENHVFYLGNCLIGTEYGLSGAYAIKAGTRCIADKAFEQRDITELTIPDSVTSIGNSAFSWCGSLTNVTIPEGVTSIGCGAFSNCGSLTSVTFPKSLTNIGHGAFSDCSKLTRISVALDHPVFCTVNGLLLSADRKRLLVWPAGLGKGAIPETVTEIGEKSFNGCQTLTELTIPESVTKIGDGAFCFCRRLTKVTVPGSVTSIGKNAFRGCRALTEVTLREGTTDIGDEAFRYSEKLKDVWLPKSVTKIGKWAFNSCDSVTIHALRGSYAEAYAKKNYIRFMAE